MGTAVHCSTEAVEDPELTNPGLELTLTGKTENNKIQFSTQQPQDPGVVM